MEILSFLLGVALMVVCIAISIGLHEVGHLVPAKIFNLKVTQYMVGFGPTAWSFTPKGSETEYGFKWIPMGGYVRMIGMYPPKQQLREPRNFVERIIADTRAASQEELEGQDHSRAFYTLATWKKIIIMLGGPIMNLVLCVVFMGIALVGIGRQDYTTTLGAVQECLPTVVQTTTKVECGPDTITSPAKQAGLTAGDEITAINGQTVQNWNDVLQRIGASAGQPVQLNYTHDGVAQEATLTAKPVQVQLYDPNSGAPLNNPDGTPQVTQRNLIGISPQVGVVRQPVSEVPTAVWQMFSGSAQVILDMPQRMVAVAHAAFSDGKRSEDSPVSVVGVTRITGEITANDSPMFTTQIKAALILSVMAGLNMGLFVFNLVPLVPLDGGHILGALINGARRQWARMRNKPDPGHVDMAKTAPLTYIVVAVLLAMSALLIYADLVNPIDVF